jgi:Dimethylamine methyltransferase (Dimeth_PyL)
VSVIRTRMGDGHAVALSRDELQLRKMRLPQAKRYVADKLGLGVTDLTDSTLLRELREELDIGVVTGHATAAKGIEAKAHIADLLGVPIRSVERLRRTIGA